jgi:hypothetical protein
MLPIIDISKARTKWTIRKYANDEAFKKDRPFEVSEIIGNVLLNEGIAVLQSLLIGGAGTDYGNTNAYIGVGDSSTGEDPAQTGLQAAVNKAWKAMEATYPQISGQATTWRAVFGSGDANYDWNEFTVVNASDDTGDNLNRKVSAQGTKASGQTWTVDVEITWS